VKIFQGLEIQRTRVELNSAPQLESATESVTVDYGTLTVFGDVSVYLLLGLLLGEPEIGAEEVLGIDPRTRDAVDSH
ncbi:uncharacterized protein METZ01_LOCUS23915, partial [marine metagenome]